MCVHTISTLPDDCLLPVFDLIPLSDLFLLDRVCPHWAILLPSACARRRTLVLIIGGLRLDEMVDFRIPFNHMPDVSFNGVRPFYNLPAAEREASLTLPSLFPNFARAIDQEEIFTEMARFRQARITGQLDTYFSNLFPNVDTLVVIHSECDEDEVDFLVELIGSWPLGTLKLWIFFADYLNLGGHPVDTLLHSIRQQQQFSIRQLTLDINHQYTSPVEYFPIFAQLELMKLCLGYYERNVQIWRLARHFDCPTLRHIGLGSDLFRVEDALNPQFRFTNKVRQLYGFWHFGTVEQLTRFCCRFASLTMLQLSLPPNISFTQLVTCLASLDQLTHLELSINFRRRPVNSFALAHRVGDGDDEELPVISLPQIKNLRLLLISARTHRELDSLSPWVFPSVEVIILLDRPRQCSTCRPNERLTGAMANRCHRLMILSLKNKFVLRPLIRLYSTPNRAETFVDWTNYVRNENDDHLPEIGDDGGNEEDQH